MQKCASSARLVFWFFLPPTAKTPALIFTIVRQMTSFRTRSPENRILHFDRNCPQTQIFCQFRWDIFASKRP